ncbi:ROK family transcriptional regulator [Solirhodobacter olei]|uniref:ROK family transcriptional regulator n=1 Tax=Solirhodobacter olei TaxID=2493082 RepID=UPI000FD6F2B1|nr:ROK family transcriptional regulator [Solirhodobacter olei]
MSVKGYQGTARAMNRRSVLHLLRTEAGLSRADLAERTGLSRASITAVVGDLIDEGLICEGEANIGAPGRRPVPLEIRYRSRLAVGIRVTSDHLECVLTDLSTEVIEAIHEPLTSSDPTGVVDAAERALARLTPLAESVGSKITGVGVGFPGSFNIETGEVIRSFRLNWHNVPLAQLLADRINLPVWIDDDTLAFALNQQLFGAGKTHRTVGVLAIGEGISCGSIIDGRVRRGAHGLAGKIGHLQIDPNGPVCECGRRGCLQAFYSLSSLQTQWENISPDASHLSLSLAAAKNHPDAVSLLRDAGEKVGHEMAMYCRFLDPSILIVGGEAALLGPALLDPLREIIRLHGHMDRCDVVVDWEERSWARGAAALATQKLFDFEAVQGAVLAGAPDSFEFSE